MKMQVFEKQANIAKAIGHPVRVAVLEFLKDGERCVCDISDAVCAERTNLSKHLSVLTAAGVLESRKDGLKVFYRLKTPCVMKFLACLKECFKEQLVEQQKMLEAMS